MNGNCRSRKSLKDFILIIYDFTKSEELFSCSVIDCEKMKNHIVVVFTPIDVIRSDHSKPSLKITAVER